MCFIKNDNNRGTPLGDAHLKKGGKQTTKVVWKFKDPFTLLKSLLNRVKIWKWEERWKTHDWNCLALQRPIYLIKIAFK